LKGSTWSCWMSMKKKGGDFPVRGLPVGAQALLEEGHGDDQDHGHAERDKDHARV